MVIVETTLDESASKTLNRASLKKLKVIMIIISLIFISFGVINIINDDLYVGIVWTSIGVLYMPFVSLLSKIFQKKINKTMSIMSVETKEKYIFDNEFVIIKQQKGEDYYSETKTKYNYFYKALETESDFILYISNVQAHVVPKNKIVEGTIEELREILSNNLNDKFKM